MATLPTAGARRVRPLCRSDQSGQGPVAPPAAHRKPTSSRTPGRERHSGDQQPEGAFPFADQTLPPRATRRVSASHSGHAGCRGDRTLRPQRGARSDQAARRAREAATCSCSTAPVRTRSRSSTWCYARVTRVVQEFVHGAEQGDVRVTLIDGRVLQADGRVAAVGRVPGGSDFRSNLHAGGQCSRRKSHSRHADRDRRDFADASARGSAPRRRRFCWRPYPRAQRLQPRGAVSMRAALRGGLRGRRDRGVRTAGLIVSSERLR